MKRKANAAGLFLAAALGSAVPSLAADQYYTSCNTSLGTGTASVYDPGLHGNPTATGIPYDRNALMGASLDPSIPFSQGTMVKVRDLRTRREVILNINDTGGGRPGRIIDLSSAAWGALGHSTKRSRLGLTEVHAYLCTRQPVPIPAQKSPRVVAMTMTPNVPYSFDAHYDAVLAPYLNSTRLSANAAIPRINP